MTLILIDIQNDYFPGGNMPLYEARAALANALAVLQKFRQKGLPVIHVQHINTRPGATFFLPGTTGAEIHPDLSPQPGEHLVVKHAPNSFLNTNLRKLLLQGGARQLLMAGMMTHMCIDTSVRAAASLGYNVTLLGDACASKSLEYDGQSVAAAQVQTAFLAALNGLFAKVIKTGELDI